MTKISSMLARAFPLQRQVVLQAASGSPFSVNPSFVMAIEGLTATTTELTVAGKGQVVINLSFADTLAALRA